MNFDKKFIIIYIFFLLDFFSVYINYLTLKLLFSHLKNIIIVKTSFFLIFSFLFLKKLYIL